MNSIYNVVITEEIKLMIKEEMVCVAMVSKARECAKNVVMANRDKECVRKEMAVKE